MKNGNIYINALKKLIETKPLGKISVSAICAECSVTRQTFYNHFKDKDELLNWYFKNQIILFDKIIPICDSLNELLNTKLHFIDSQRKLYKEAIISRKNDELIIYFQDIIFKRLNVILHRNINDEILSKKLSKELTEYCKYIIDTAVRWTISNDDSFETVNKITEKCPNSLKPYLVDKF